MVNKMTDNKAGILHFRFIVVFLFTINMITGCYPYIGDAKEVEQKREERYYLFDSTTILDALKRGSLNVFTLSKSTPKPESFTPSVKAKWTQADYLLVAQAVQQDVWRESLGSLDLYYAIFTMDCSDAKLGTFNMVDFVLYKLIKAEDVETRVQYHITIIPSENYLYTSRAEYYPNVSVIEPTALSQYQITAEKALQIAEMNGGVEKRSEYEKSCMITGIVNGLDGWTVSYQTRNEYRWAVIFEIEIDSQTGSFKVTRP